SEVRIIQHFTFRELADDWGTAGQKLAPVPPVLAMAMRYGFPIELSGQPAALPIATHSGPYSGIVGAEAVEYAIHGLQRYIDQPPVDNPGGNPQAEELVRELRGEVAKMMAAGPLASA